MGCVCGVPSQANYHVEIIVGRGDSSTGTETDSVDKYMCSLHVEEWEEGDGFPRNPLGEWTVVESKTNHLRGDV